MAPTTPYYACVCVCVFWNPKPFHRYGPSARGINPHLHDLPHPLKNMMWASLWRPAIRLLAPCDLQCLPMTCRYQLVACVRQGPGAYLPSNLKSRSLAKRQGRPSRHRCHSAMTERSRRGKRFAWRWQTNARCATKASQIEGCNSNCAMCLTQSHAII